ncbi:MIP/aquaporin family protein [Pseudoramibacter alactolyticus]|uniref:MIP/aquaporin family protein n=1 Tax=Pseudoramibacter alactolyticus TaxID=113287 RepID=UPI002355078C|nr:MIP/aquaporin family protein [Pseudoramibacter alactolyticus]MBM6968623.1 aquaporin family protein [Pseudoramibacter alactolyticus]
MIPYLSEFIGTAMLVLLGDGVCCGQNLEGTNWKGAGSVHTIIGWGLAVGLPAMAFGAQSGAHFNPAVTLGMACIGNFEWSMVPGYIVCQMLGGFVGAIILWLYYKPQFDATTDPGTIKGCFCTAPHIKNTFFNFLSEFIATFFLLFFILTIPASVGAAGASAFVVDMIIMCVGYSLGATTGFSMNAARDFSPRLAHAILPIPNKGDSDFGYAWNAAITPILGGICGAFVGQMVVGWL